MVQDAGKRAAAEAAAEWVAEMASQHAPDRMLLGLGSGSTAEMFLAALGVMPKERIANISGMPTSDRTEAMAREQGIAIMEPAGCRQLHLAVDGADEIDPKLRLVKGGGGALLRERIVAEAADELMIIAERRKMVEKLGAFPLPVEIVPFGAEMILGWIRESLERYGYDVEDGAIAQVRRDGGSPFVTDEGNWIVDLRLGEIQDADIFDMFLCCVPGVISTGVFAGLLPRVILGEEDGTISVLEPAFDDDDEDLDDDEDCDDDFDSDDLARFGTGGGGRYR